MKTVPLNFSARWRDIPPHTSNGEVSFQKQAWRGFSAVALTYGHTM